MRRDIFGAMKAKKAAVQYGHPSKSLQLIIVAGSSGKTTVAKMLAELLREAGKKVAVFTSSDSFVEEIPYTPVYAQSPAAIQKALSAARKQRCEVVIMQMQGALTRRQILSTLHIDLALALDDGEGTAALLAQPLVYAVIPSGLSTERLMVAPHQMISVGETDTAEAKISDIKLYRKGTELRLTIDHQTVIELATYLVGRMNAINAAFTAAAGYVLGVPVDIIPEGIARLESIQGNFQTIKYDGQAQIVVDSSSNRQDIEQLVSSAKQLTRRRLMLVSDSSVDSQVIRDIKPAVDRLIGVAGHSQALTDEADSLEEAVAIGLRAAKKDDLVLLVGQDFSTATEKGTTRAEEIVGANHSE